METVWTSSPELEQLYLEVTVNEGLGIVVLQESREEEPKMVFCSLFPDSEKFFFCVNDRRDVGVTIAEMKEVLATIERKIAERPFLDESVALPSSYFWHFGQ